MATVPLRKGVDANHARAELAKLIDQWESKNVARYKQALGELIAGQASVDEATHRIGEVLEDDLEDLWDDLPEVLDRCWDFSVLPGGAVGVALEAVDGPFFEALSMVARDVGRWIAEAMTPDDANLRRRAAKLEARATEIEMRAKVLERNGRAHRATFLRETAKKKRERAAKLYRASNR